MFDINSVSKPLQIAAKKYNTVQEAKKNVLTALASTNTRPAQVLISIETCELPDPLKLFGALVKSKVVNRISFYQAEPCEQSATGYRRGRKLMETLMTDQAFSEAVFNANSSDGLQPCTHVELDGLIVRHDKLDQRPNPLAFELDQGFNRKQYDGFIQEITTIIDALDNGAGLSKSRKESLERITQWLISNSKSDYSHRLNCVDTALRKNSLALSIEMSHTIDKLGRIYRGAQQYALPAPTKETEDFNLLAFIASGGYTERDFQQFRQILQQTPDAYLGEKENRESLLSNHARRSDTHDHHMANGSLKVTRCTGDTPLFGEQYTVQGFYYLSFSAAYYDESHSSVRLREGAEFFRIALSHEAMLLMLRGNLNNEPVPCTLQRYAGRGFDYAEELADHNLRQEREDSTKSQTLYKNTDASLATLIDIIANASNKKADRMAIVDHVRILLAQYNNEYDGMQNTFDQASAQRIVLHDEALVKTLDRFETVLAETQLTKQQLLAMLDKPKNTD
jgi:hypothetical protein